jgi:glycosyltransferase involved in cell wall biosynthesis
MNTTSAGTHPPEGQTRANSAYRTASVSGPAPVVSVVLPVRDVGTTIGEQLAALSVQDFTGRWEVVVADNGSRDATLDVVEAWCDRLPGLRVVHAHRRRGVSHARNVGAAAARAELLAICDGDDVVTPRWLSAIVTASERYDLVAGRLDDDALNPPVVRAWRPSHPADGAPVIRGFLPYAVGANCAVWKRVVEDVGGWNEDYLSGNDVEFAWRVQLRGHQLGFAPDAVVRYRYRGDLWGWARQAYNGGRASARLVADFRPHGLPPVPLRRVGRNWLRLVVRAPRLLRPGPRGWWVGEAAGALGRAVGSVERRVVAL